MTRSRSIGGILALLLVLAVLGAAVARAQPADPLRLTPDRLDNGLEVILVEDHAAPTVAVDVWYKVGSADDPRGRSGFAHLFEHMMFQGSANVPPGLHSELITAAGGSSNASTSLDRTNYYQTLPAHQLPLALWLEADRMRSLVVDDTRFAREREVVKEEYRLRVDNQPYGEAALRLQTLPFDYPPYQQPTIGSVADLDAATVDEVRAFHAAYYKPNNAVLVVAGDIDPDQARDLVRRYFADIPRRDPPPPLPTYTFSPAGQPQQVQIDDRLARVPAAFIAHRVPPRGQPDYYAAELLGRVLGGGGSSRLARALTDTGLATSANTSVSGNRGPGLFGVTLVPNPGVELERLERVVDDELERIRADGVDRAELEKAINQIRTNRIASLQSALGLAESVQGASFYLGDPRGAFTELDRYRGVSSDDVRRVAQQYLGQESRTVITVNPVGGAR